MSEERLAAVERTLVDVKHDVGDVRERLGGVETRLDGVETRLSRVETRLGGVETRLGGVETAIVGLDRRLGRVEINQETMRDEIHQIAEGHAATQALIQRGFEGLRAHIDRRIDPLERALKEHLRAS